MQAQTQLFDPDTLIASPASLNGQLSLWRSPEAIGALDRASVGVLEHLLNMARHEAEAAVIRAAIARARRHRR